MEMNGLTEGRRNGRRHGPAIVAGGALIAGWVLVAGFAAAQSGSGDQYTGCLSKKGGVYSVDIGAEPVEPCKDKDTQISWNQTGPTGLPGADGAAGPAGESGLPGSTGPSGSAGGLHVVDADGEVVGPLAAGPFNNVGSPVLVGFGTDFAWIGIDGTAVSLGEFFSGALYFESNDCSGPPLAAGSQLRHQDWYGYAMPWPASGPDRKGYTVTSTDLSWVGVSTTYSSTYTAGTGTGARCIPGAPGQGGAFLMRTVAFGVVEVPDALILDSFPGPLTIQAVTP